MKYIIPILLVLLVVITGCTNQSNTQGTQEIKKTTTHNGQNINDYPIETLSEDEIIALNLTLNDEYKAEAIYQKVIDKFGDVKPFINIIKAEQKHSDTLIQLYNKYNLTVPTNDWYTIVPEFESVTAACSAGIDAEIENAKLYDKLFSKVNNQDIIAVFTSLRDASLNNHLPAFEKCANK